MKKIELHVHLEGTIRPALALKLAKRNRVSLNPNIIAGESYRWHDFAHFLQVYDEVAAVIKAPIDYYDLTHDYLTQLAQQDCLYVELMYSPEHAERATGIPSAEHLKAIQQAIDDIEQQFGLIARLIITGVRHYGVKSVEHTALHAAQKQVPSIVGFGLGGDEINFPAPLFKKAYAIANDAGLGCTVHVGEFTGPKAIEEAILQLPVTRIGHGVRAIESPDTMQRIKDQQIALEICPSSNIATGVYPSLEEHPIKKLFDEGLKISISSDDPPYFQTSLTHEYQVAVQHCGLSEENLYTINKMAIEASFANSIEKAHLQSLNIIP